MSRFLLPLIVALALAGCATMTVSSHVAPDIKTAAFSTYDWGPADALPTGDPRLDKDPFFRDRVQGAVDRQFTSKGIALAASGRPDLLIHYHASITRRLDPNQVDRGYGYCYGNDCLTAASATEYEAGTLVLDIVDTRTNKVIWRGWAQGTIDDVLNDQERMARRIDRAVTRMLEGFPWPH